MTYKEILELPNIFQLIDFLKAREMEFMEKYNYWRSFPLIISSPHIRKSLIDKDRIYVNDEDGDKFIVNRLCSGRYSFKPNLHEHCYLYRGQNKKYDTIESSFSRKDTDDRLVSNLKAEDFMGLLRTHPLFMLFENGIHLEPEHKPLFFEMAYYGLAQHYGFNTGLIDFSSDISVAAFFACTEYKGDDKYEPIIDINKYPYGVIYVHQINPFASFNVMGFRSCGLQVFPRTGAQKGFFFEEAGNKPIKNFVQEFRFRHDPICSRRVYQLQEAGKKLFPEDNIQPFAKYILDSDEITGATFATNLYRNQDDINKNLEKLEKKNVKVNWNKQLFFSSEMLHSYFQDIKNGWWEAFCKQISFCNENEEKLKDSLLRIPQSPYYRQFFDEKEYSKLQYIALDNKKRAEASRQKS